MNNAIPAFFATILVASLLAIPVVSSGPTAGPAAQVDLNASYHHTHSEQETPVEVDDTTNRLPLIGEIRDERAEYGSDLGVSLASSDSQLRVDHAQYTLVEREFDDASDAEREEMVRSAYNDILDRIEAIEDREEEAVLAHARGDLTDRELIQTLLRNQDEAAALENALDDLTEERTPRIDGYDLSYQQIGADKTVLDLHQTSIRSSLEQAAKAPDQEVDVRVRTAQKDDDVIGYSLSTIEQGTYVRETVRFDNRRSLAVPDDFEDSTNSETMAYATDRYPWAGEEQGWSWYSDQSNRNLYVLSMERDQNQLEVYLDGGAGEVYREYQELSVESLPADDVETWTDGSLELELTTTPANGPAEITVTDAESNESVEATVLADGTEVGTTGTDGTLWFIPPLGDYELTVETDTEDVTVSVE
ncbi:hypothetical protein RBH26_10860 [Natronolimnohabitans sp. A-GB9]|uniref:DUF7096 domain-containing protein n=1 Tax=Natronolimnohabitans sp. A-GB9 TaxID=3069757 RepID=UPI0027B31233|nr:hypothetical protein [Natronolimnohabitans sp. A-GB9]MDQ2050979.1 hypothetical protein [Natronolimnohabitans sp. A-GB9]